MQFRHWPFEGAKHPSIIQGFVEAPPREAGRAVVPQVVQEELLFPEGWRVLAHAVFPEALPADVEEYLDRT